MLYNPGFRDFLSVFFLMGLLGRFGVGVFGVLVGFDESLGYLLRHRSIRELLELGGESVFNNPRPPIGCYGANFTRFFAFYLHCLSVAPQPARWLWMVFYGLRAALFVPH